MKESLKSLITKVQIAEIRLVEASASTRIRAPIEMGAMTLKLGKSATVDGNQSNGCFCVIATIDARLLEQDSTDDPAVAIKATFELRYTLPAEVASTAEDLSSFAEMNGVYNAWPYWREFIQSTISRMNLPPVVLPVFRIGKALEETSDPKQQETSE